MAARRPEPAGRLDWRASWGGGEAKPCMYCGKPALLRHPLTGKPAHKFCDDAQYAQPQQ